MNRRSRVFRAAAVIGTALICTCLPAAAVANDGGDHDGGGDHGRSDVLFVSHTATPTGSDTSCATAKYSTVQSAVDAAQPGQTVYLCGTTPYQESVLVQKDLRLTGDRGATIQAPQALAASSMPNTTFFSSQGLETPNSVVTVIGKVEVEVDGLTIEGPFNNTGCSPDDFGVLAIDGARVGLNEDQVLHIRASNAALGGCQYGVGIQIGRRYWPYIGHAADKVVNFVGQADISETRVADYQKNGITVDGPSSEADIYSSLVDGGGPTAAIARNGIQIGRGATGEVAHSAVNNNEYTGTGGFASATGILVFGGGAASCGGGDPLSTNVHIERNYIHNNDSGVVLSNTDPNDPTCSAAPPTRTDNEVSDNYISKSDGETNHSPFTDAKGNPYTGYQTGIGDTGNNDVIVDNTIVGTGSSHADTAYGPQTAPGAPFLAPIDIQTYPPINPHVHDNTFDGHPTNPPY